MCRRHTRRKLIHQTGFPRPRCHDDQIVIISGQLGVKGPNRFRQGLFSHGSVVQGLLRLPVAELDGGPNAAPCPIYQQAKSFQFVAEIAFEMGVRQEHGSALEVATIVVVCVIVQSQEEGGRKNGRLCRRRLGDVDVGFGLQPIGYRSHGNQRQDEVADPTYPH